MNLIESLQIEAPRMTSDTTCIAKMNLGESTNSLKAI